MTTYTRRHRVAMVVMAVLGLAGCAIGGGSSESPAPSPGPTTAPEILAEAGLTLPASATGVRVEFVEHDLVQGASVITFTAPRTDVEAMCRAVGVEPLPDRGAIDYEAEMLGDHAPKPGDVGCVTMFTAPRAAFVNMSEGDPTEAAVLVYEVPSRPR